MRSVVYNYWQLCYVWHCLLCLISIIQLKVHKKYASHRASIFAEYSIERNVQFGAIKTVGDDQNVAKSWSLPLGRSIKAAVVADQLKLKIGSLIRHQCDKSNVQM